MKKALCLLIIGALLIGCGKDGTNGVDDSINTIDVSFKCDNKEDYLNTLSIGDIIDGDYQTITDAEQQVLYSVTPSIYTSGSYYNADYTVCQYNTDTHEWCYYYSIDVDKNFKITSIYKH